MRPERTLSAVSVAAMLVSMHYRTGFVVGTGEKALTLGAAASTRSLPPWAYWPCFCSPGSLGEMRPTVDPARNEVWQPGQIPGWDHVMGMDDRRSGSPGAWRCLHTEVVGDSSAHGDDHGGGGAGTLPCLSRREERTQGFLTAGYSPVSASRWRIDGRRPYPNADHPDWTRCRQQ
jgi:hypothetical protein